MGHRLSKIYTRTGDDGTTGLANGDRVKKSGLRVAAFGSVDETNSALGMVLADTISDARLRDSLTRIQNELFDLGAELSFPGYTGIGAVHVAQLEKDLDTLNAELPPLKEFVLPGGTQAAATCHLARSISRRAEREAWQLAEHEEVSTELLKYLNRLSDLLFVAARCLARQNGGTEPTWNNPNRAE